jgi:hypothetical protein
VELHGQVVAQGRYEELLECSNSFRQMTQTTRRLIVQPPEHMFNDNPYDHGGTGLGRYENLRSATSPGS